MSVKTVDTHIRLTPSDHKLLSDIAEKLDLSLSQVVRRAIREMAKKNKVT